MRLFMRFRNRSEGYHNRRQYRLQPCSSASRFAVETEAVSIRANLPLSSIDNERSLTAHLGWQPGSI